MLDDDFFELDEDLLNATNFDKTDEAGGYEEEQVCHELRYLICTGEDLPNKHLFHADSFIVRDELRLIESHSKKVCNQNVFELDLSEDTLSNSRVLQNLLNKSRTNMQTLFVSSRENSMFMTRSSYFSLRQQTTTFLFQLRQLLYTGRIKYNIAETLLRPLATYLEQLNALPIVDVLHTIHSTLGNESTSPAYHLLHGHMEWRWIYLTICLRIEQEKLNQTLMSTENMLRDTYFEEKLQLFIYDLMVISIAKFNKLHTLELSTKTPFACSCTKEVWLLIQLLVDKLHAAGKLNSFWSYFNTALNMHRERKNPYATMKNLSIARDTVDVYPTDSTLFSLWLLSGVAVLNGFSENGTFCGSSCTRIRENAEMLESLLKSFTSSEPSEQHLRTSLLVVNSPLINWWQQRSESIMIFWEYFHKKLNSSFFVSGGAPSALAVTSNTALGYIEQVQQILANDNLNTNMSSFTIFLSSVGKLLKRFYQTDMKNQIKKIHGRIFTKFGETKLYALNEIGIHNLITLFLVLATTTPLQEISQRLQTILLQLKLDKIPSPRQTCLMKGHMALLILYSDQEITMTIYVGRLLEQVNSLNADESKLPVLRIMFDSLEKIYQKHDIFEFGAFSLIDKWIIEYLSLCVQVEQEKCLQFMNQLFIRIVNDHGLKQQYPEQVAKLVETLFKLVLPHVKQIYRQSNIFSSVPEIAATFCINTSEQHFHELFKYFTEATCCDILITTKFLVNILSTNKIHTIDQILSIRLWLKCSILSTSANDDIRQLTRIVIRLPNFQMLCQSTETEILDAKEPLSIFFASCGELYEAASDLQRKQIAESLQSAISGFEKWVPISESPPAIFKIHIVIALVIFHCAPIVYVRSKPTCFFSTIMNHYILPLPLLMGKPQKLISIQAVHKVWHLIVGGIEKLDYQLDAQLQKVFTDLVVKWIPQFRSLPVQKLITKPFITCARHSKASTLQFILEKIVANFLSAQRRETHQNAPIAVAILTDILGDISSECEKVKILLNTTTITLLEHAMMVDESLSSRTMIFDFFGNLFKSAAYISTYDIRNIVTSNLKTLTTKNLSYYSSFYFQFMHKFSKLNAKCVVEILPHIREQVLYVEQLRNAGPDAKLRNSLKQLEESLKK